MRGEKVQAFPIKQKEVSTMVQEPGWSWRSHPKRFIVTLVVVTLLAALLGGGYGLLVSKAQGACVTTTGEPCPNVQPRDKRAARKFRNDKIHHASGFSPQKVFKRPRVAKRIFVNKIERLLAKSGKATTFAEPGCTDRCEAYRIYSNLIDDANCTDRGATYPIDPGTCAYPDNARPFTKDDVQNAGAAILCGGAVVIGVVSSAASAGTTAFIAGWGATSCLWAFWSAVD